MSQITFVVWRECFEALLVIGIIYSWFNKQTFRAQAMRYLYAGVALGVVLAIALAFIIYGTFSSLGDSDIAQNIFLVVMSALACVLIVQMVYWMYFNGSTLKSTLSQEIGNKVAQHSWWGVVFIVAIAIAREGSEIVVFLSGQISQLTRETSMGFLRDVAIGIILSTLTFYAFVLTSKVCSWKPFFIVTGFILLCLAVSLLMKSIETLVGALYDADYSGVEPLMKTLWDTSMWLKDSIIADDFFGYRSQPMLISAVTFFLYWVVVVFLFAKKQHGKA